MFAHDFIFSNAGVFDLIRYTTVGVVNIVSIPNSLNNLSLIISICNIHKNPHLNQSHKAFESSILYSIELSFRQSFARLSFSLSYSVVSIGYTHAYTYGLLFLNHGIAIDWIYSLSSKSAFVNHHTIVSQICASRTDFNHVTMYHICHFVMAGSLTYSGEKCHTSVGWIQILE
jgi:hypothetical protein